MAGGVRKAMHRVLFALERGGVGMESVGVVVDVEKFARKKLSEGLEDEKERVWLERVKRNPSMVAGRKYRLGEWGVGGERGGVWFGLGLTDYGEFVGTNGNKDMLKEMMEYGEEVYGDGTACLAHTLGVNCVVWTKDGYVVLQKRSMEVGVEPGKWDVPGGHPEPDMVDGSEEERIVEELFDSAKREVLEELNVKVEKELRLVGGIGDESAGGRMTLVFETSVDLDALEVVELWKSATDAYETTDLKFLKRMDTDTVEEGLKEASPFLLYSSTLTSPVPLDSTALTVACKGALEIVLGIAWGVEEES